MQINRELYEPIIGLEVHVQLQTHSKIFTDDAPTYGASPNTQVGVVSLAHPGTLPVLNKKVLEYAIKMGLACRSEISRYIIFDRKNYFYPDLPKGYQITQDRTPICRGGNVSVRLKNGTLSEVQLNRIHLEEDAGKSMHEASETWLDFNRAGVALIEIVTEPVLTTSEEAYAFLTEIRKLVQYLEISDGNMEEGSLRCDVNISVRVKGTQQLGKKVEIKNLNSIRNVQRAIEREIDRQLARIEKGESIISETRTFVESTGDTLAMRTKEELNDYRYFPDPDLSPVSITDAWLEEIKSTMPALPQELVEKFTSDYGIPEYDARVITESKAMAIYFESVCQLTNNFKAVSNWIMGPVKSAMNELTPAGGEIPIAERTLAELIQLVDEGKISFTAASQRVFPELIKKPNVTPMEVAQQLDVMQERDEDALNSIVEGVLNEYPEKVAEFKKGKKGILSLFMGEVMKQTKGKADPKMANKLLIEKIKEL